MPLRGHPSFPGAGLHNGICNDPSGNRIPVAIIRSDFKRRAAGLEVLREFMGQIDDGQASGSAALDESISLRFCDRFSARERVMVRVDREGYAHVSAFAQCLEKRFDDDARAVEPGGFQRSPRSAFLVRRTEEVPHPGDKLGRIETTVGKKVLSQCRFSHPALGKDRLWGQFESHEQCLWIHAYPVDITRTAARLPDVEAVGDQVEVAYADILITNAREA